MEIVYIKIKVEKKYYRFDHKFSFCEFLGKNKEWSAHDPLTAFLFVSDGFLLNLNMILLNLARPFAEPYSPRLLKIDPLYVVTENAHVHLKGNELYSHLNSFHWI